jgi:hypothetical protein
VGRKDRERYLRLKNENPDYSGFRGRDTVTTRSAAVTETVVCSVCNRRRNVAADTLPEDRSTFVCLRCQEEQAEEVSAASNTEEPE